MVQPKPLSAFNRLSPCVYLYTPSTTTAPPLSDPSTILLCSWNNAAPKHISYYTSYYTKLFPLSRIVLCTMKTSQFLLQSEAQRRRDAAPAIDALFSESSDQGARLLVHCISNGGGKRFYGIAGLYQSQKGKPLPISSIVYDSCPSLPWFKRDLHALLHVPGAKLPWLLYIPLAVIAIIVASIVYVIVHYCPHWVWRDLVRGPLEGLNDERLVRKEAARGYIYSEEDEVIEWKDVEEHGEVGTLKGYRVERIKMVGGKHAQMFRGEGGEEAYWGFVMKLWVGASKEI
ncbi:uncharacterized protein EAF01_011870 [Botrytis porri]|uniref:Indole-diterpene biosynthesis protein PaxU n=1 Tax=Botrytis porri TaxID=87229 RepID=A0A4Z1KJ35_9HELO|nr:uncharacterized protein EAF01_011870 [Botrytis porri]KAF7881359.1 hypothetical protein EAF01_011870 [Botrytis porri]TGO83584.1 hypothetical protein BPOR_0624g00070 [Botrytis porri]